MVRDKDAFERGGGRYGGPDRYNPIPYAALCIAIGKDDGVRPEPGVCSREARVGSPGTPLRR